MDEMISHELPGNIFMQPWWLDCVAPGRWKDIKIEKGGNVFARWPIVTRKEKGFIFVEMPLLTQKIGPWIKKTSDKQEKIHRNERDLLTELISKLPSFDKFSYNLNSEIINYLPFTWAGFTQSSLTTFQIKYPFDEGEIWKELKSSVRRDIRRADEELTVKPVDCHILYDMVTNTFKRKNKSPKYSLELIESLYSELTKRNRGQIFGAVDATGKVHAAQMLVHDCDVSYYLIGGFDPESQIPGAVSLLLWNAIKVSHGLKNTFDFEGSSVQGVEKYFSSFGAEVVHSHVIKGVSKRFAPIYFGKELLNKIRS